MTREDRVRAVKTKRILRTRNYGFEKLTRDYQKDILRAVYNEKEMQKIIKSAYYELGGQQESLDEIYTILSRRLERLFNKVKLRIKTAFDFGNKKLTDSKGQKLTLKKPNYEAQINALTEHNLRYVKDITEKQKEKITTELSEAIKTGKTYSEVGRKINQEVKGISLERSKLIASTEMNRAISESMQTTLKYNGVNYYIYLTAEDERVSKICNKNSYGNDTGKGMRLKHVVGNGPIPVRDSHPRCRCVIAKAPD
jgi:SPP1 gp7 family putative phage head morphogenesis protein